MPVHSHKLTVFFLCHIYDIAVCECDTVFAVLCDIRHVYNVCPMRAIKIFTKLPHQLFHRRVDLYTTGCPKCVYLHLFCPALNIQDISLSQHEFLCLEKQTRLTDSHIQNRSPPHMDICIYIGKIR